MEGYYEGPYYSYYKFPLTFQDTEESLHEAYEMLDDFITEEGPFDGAIGFSHGGTLIAGFLIHHAKTKPYVPPPLRCVVFFNSLPPFRMQPGDGERSQIQVDPGLEGYLNIPTVSAVGKKDFVYEFSLELYRLCNSRLSALITHDKGHDVPRDPVTVSAIAGEVRKMFTEVEYGL